MMHFPMPCGAHRLPATVLLALAIAACGEPTEPSTTEAIVPVLSMDDAVSSERTILPRATSLAGEIDWVPLNNPATALHHVWLPARHIPRTRLFLFMPGTGNQPGNYKLFSAEAAAAGYHVIGLMYQNDRALENICKASLDPDCAENVRMESLTGEALSPLVTVTEGNSIDHRLERLLVHLSGSYPKEGWDAFLLDGKPDWSRIVVGGQSQGAGQAALIARERLVPRVVMLSGPPDQSNVPAIDSWVRIGRTQASSMYALYHLADRLSPGIEANMGAGGFNLAELGIVEVGTEGPWCGGTHSRPITDHQFLKAHVVVTDLVPRGEGECAGITAGNPHRSTARDEFTPLTLDGKRPALVSAWRYLIGDPADVKEQ